MIRASGWRWSVLLVILVCTAVGAEDFYVMPSGSDAGDGSWQSPWRTIQHAIDAVEGSAAEPHRIHVGPGTYDEHLVMDEGDSYESLMGAGAGSVFVDAGSDGHVLWVFGASHLRVTGITFQGGGVGEPGGPSSTVVLQGEEVEMDHCVVRWSHGLYQSGVLISGPNRLHDCEIYENACEETNGHAGGVYVTYPEGARVYRNHIHDNFCDGINGGGGGIFLFYTTAELSENHLEANESVHGSAALHVRYGHPSILGNVIRENLSSSGPALRLEGAHPVFQNNLVADNDCPVAVRVTGGFTVDDTGIFRANTVVADQTGVSWANCPAPDRHAPITGCILWAQGSSLVLDDTALELSFSCVGDPEDTGPGVIHDDPLFLDDQYHLSSDSPCIDTGDPALDFCGEPWPHGCRVNMGAYAGTFQAALSGIDECTPTCPPSCTPTATPTASPTWGPPATLTPGPTPPSPSPTPASGDGLRLDLELSDWWFSAGDLLRLTLHLENHGPATTFQQFLCLEVEGSYFFHPLWQSEPLGLERTLGADSSLSDVILELVLPAPLEPGGPFHFYAILLDPITAEPLTPLASQVFLFGGSRPDEETGDVE